MYTRPESRATKESREVVHAPPVGSATRTPIPYNERIDAISQFFGISAPAALFMYHRRRRGHPFKKSDDSKFLEWDIKLQNSLIKADEYIGWDWGKVRFGREVHILAKFDILLDQQTNEVYRNEKKSDSSDEWTVVKNVRKENSRHTKLMSMLGFIPHRRILTKPVRQATPMEHDSDTDTSSSDEDTDMTSANVAPTNQASRPLSWSSVVKK